MLSSVCACSPGDSFKVFKGRLFKGVSSWCFLLET